MMNDTAQYDDDIAQYDERHTLQYDERHRTIERKRGRKRGCLAWCVGIMVNVL